MNIMKAFDTTEEKQDDIFDQILSISHMRTELGAYLIMSSRVARADKISLNLHLHAIVKTREEYRKDQGWSHGCMSMGLIALVARLDTINNIAAKYPSVVRQYHKIQEQAERPIADCKVRTPSGKKKACPPKTKFLQTWKGHFRKPLLDEFLMNYCHSDTLREF